jgi:hypothetical protein
LLGHDYEKFNPDLLLILLPFKYRNYYKCRYCFKEYSEAIKKQDKITEGVRYACEERTIESSEKNTKD